jgi:ribosomal protein RSM22 (predicted rRNA methylase)
MVSGLPPALQAAVNALLEGRPRGPIAERATKISECYRGGGQSGAAIASDADVMAYLLARLPATYAVALAVLREVKARSDFAPQTVTDIGAGPGTASWAAIEIWPGLDRVAMIDSSAVFLDMARKLAANSPNKALSGAATTLADLTRLPALHSSDLVIASYTLAELPHEKLINVAATLWKSCAGLLILVEPGTPAGYERILACRSALITQGAKMVAPCPHAARCPIAAPDWCHFSQRLARSRDHMFVKSANVPFEDEKFSYLAVAREHIAVESYEARVLAPPKKDKTGIAMKVCAHGEISLRKIPRRDRAQFSRLRDTRWGGSL